MMSVESNTHVFVIKVWVEEQASAQHAGTWRGHITHVMSGQREHLDQLAQVQAFMVPYLRQLGIQFPEASDG